jgi:prepilin-type N-terminal cleavage/methylation domain-containing protein
MVHGSNVARGHRGMRKGISLMEMLVAIILLGILSSVGYNYYKNYFDTSLSAKQIKVSVLIEQAAQLKNALELYKVKFGADVNTTQGLNELAVQSIITEVPAAIPDMSDQGWILNTGGMDIDSTLITSLGGTTLADQVITYDLNGTTTAIADRMDYCNALNNIASNGVTNYAVSAATLALDDVNESATKVSNTFFCWDTDATDNADGLQFLFMTKIY